MKRLPKWILVLALLSLGLLAWLYYRSPAFALRELEKAIREKDLAVFYKRVDLEGLYRSSIDALATKNLADTKDKPGFLDTAGAQLGAGLEKISAATAIDLLKQSVAKVPNITRTPAVDVEILEFNEFGPKLAVRPYCNTAHYWQVYFDTNKSIADTLGAAGFPVATHPVRLYPLDSASRSPGVGQVPAEAPRTRTPSLA